MSARIDYLTPTAHAEAGYRPRPRKPLPIGPAGIGIPVTEWPYRSTLDQDLLNRIAKAAFEAHQAEKLPPEVCAAAARIMIAEVERIFPPADMAVLGRYELAAPTESVMIEIQADGERSHWIELGQSVTIPKDRRRFRLDMGGAARNPSSFPPAPDALRPYIATVMAVRQAKAALSRAQYWPGHFKKQHARAPRWREIEREFPAIGVWLAEQRKGIGE